MHSGSSPSNPPSTTFPNSNSSSVSIEKSNTPNQTNFNALRRSTLPPQLSIIPDRQVSLSRSLLSPPPSSFNHVAEGYYSSQGIVRDDAITPRQNFFPNPDYQYQNQSLTPITSSFFQDSHSRALYTDQASSTPILEGWQPDSDLSPNDPSSNCSSTYPLSSSTRQQDLGIDSHYIIPKNRDSESYQDVRRQEARMATDRLPAEASSTSAADKPTQENETQAKWEGPNVEREGLKEEYARIW